MIHEQRRKINKSLVNKLASRFDCRAVSPDQKKRRDDKCIAAFFGSVLLLLKSVNQRDTDKVLVILRGGISQQDHIGQGVDADTVETEVSGLEVLEAVLDAQGEILLGLVITNQADARDPGVDVGIGQERQGIRADICLGGGIRIHVIQLQVELVLHHLPVQPATYGVDVIAGFHVPPVVTEYGDPIRPGGQRTGTAGMVKSALLVIVVLIGEVGIGGQVGAGWDRNPD